MSATTGQPEATRATLPGAVGWLLVGGLSVALFTQAVLEDQPIAGAFASQPLWLSVVESLGGKPEAVDGGTLYATVPLAKLSILVGVATLLTWAMGAMIISRFSGRSWRQSAIAWGSRGWKWWCLCGIWYLLWLVGLLMGAGSLAAVVAASVDLWWAVALAGWWSTFVTLMQAQDAEVPPLRVRGWMAVCIAIAVYTVVFTWMNWELYWGLLLPHGDSAMYEEHLWNFTHGKGFRSYLDQGLFLGEHIQFIHLALLPAYVFWPSQLLLELCESLALASSALPVYWIARRHTGSERAAVWLAAATLLYFPLHYLDIAIDLKTFRPICFGVPLLLLAIDQLERGRWRTMTLLLVVTLTAKEDYAIVIAPLGTWLFLTSWWNARHPDRVPVNSSAHQPSNASTGVSLRTSPGHPEWMPTGLPGRQGMIVGAAMAVLATVYLLLAVKVLIPWFREGETVHYVRYFSRFGNSPTEIVTNMLTNPGLLLGEFLTAGTVLYAMRVVVPLGGTPLLSPGRLLVGAPLFLVLCLNELAQETPAPVHHFHAPLLPVVFWAAAAGIGNVVRRAISHQPSAINWAKWACLCALTTGLLTSIHPLSRKFWDSGSAMYWRNLYIPGERAERFAEILPLIPPTARVASTDFVHPRFTHFERSYDYSGYLRKVADYEQRVPDDTEYIVIDTRHPYSTMHSPADVPEFHQPDQWELLTTEPDPWFIVLKRRRDAGE